MRKQPIKNIKEVEKKIIWDDYHISPYDNINIENEVRNYKAGVDPVKTQIKGAGLLDESFLNANTGVHRLYEDDNLIRFWITSEQIDKVLNGTKFKYNPNTGTGEEIITNIPHLTGQTGLNQYGITTYEYLDKNDEVIYLNGVQKTGVECFGDSYYINPEGIILQEDTMANIENKEKEGIYDKYSLQEAFKKKYLGKTVKLTYPTIHNQHLKDKDYTVMDVVFNNVSWDEKYPMICCWLALNIENQRVNVISEMFTLKEECSSKGIEKIKSDEQSDKYGNEYIIELVEEGKLYLSTALRTLLNSDKVSFAINKDEGKFFICKDNEGFVVKNGIIESNVDYRELSYFFGQENKTFKVNHYPTKDITTPDYIFHEVGLGLKPIITPENKIEEKVIKKKPIIQGGQHDDRPIIERDFTDVQRNTIIKYQKQEVKCTDTELKFIKTTSEQERKRIFNEYNSQQEKPKLNFGNVVYKAPRMQSLLLEDSIEGGLAIPLRLTNKQYGELSLEDCVKYQKRIKEYYDKTGNDIPLLVSAKEIEIEQLELNEEESDVSL